MQAGFCGVFDKNAVHFSLYCYTYIIFSFYIKMTYYILFYTVAYEF